MSKEEEEKKRKRNQLAIGLVLIGLMVLSSVGYAFTNQDDPNTNLNKVSYNRFDFVSNNGLWQLSLGNFIFYFTNNPNEVNQLNAGVNLLSSYSGKPLYIMSKDTSTELEIYRNLDQVILRRQYACLDGKPCADANLPLKTCDDNFIIIEESNSSEIRQDKNCVYISGQKQELVKVADEFLFKLMNIR